MRLPGSLRIGVAAALVTGCSFDPLPVLTDAASVGDSGSDAPVDADARKVRITAGPSNGGTSGPYVSFSFVVTEGVAQCRTDDGVFAMCASPITWSLGSGPHTFTVRAVDGAGELHEDTRSWTVDCVAPAGGPGVLGLFHFDESTDSQVLTNASGGAVGRLGSTQGVDTSDPTRILPGRYGVGALRFVTAQTDIATLLGVSNAAVTAHTVELWLRLTADPGASTVLATEQQMGFTQLSLRLNGPRLTYALTPTQGGCAVTTNNLAPNVWHHVVATYRPSTQACVLWVDGVGLSPASFQLSDPIDWATIDLGPTSVDLDELVFRDTTVTDVDVLGNWCPP